VGVSRPAPLLHFASGPINIAMETSSRPLADYFWIAGIEHISYHDGTPQPSPCTAPVDAPSTIAEDAEEHGAPDERPSMDGCNENTSNASSNANANAHADGNANANVITNATTRSSARFSRHSASRQSKISIYTFDEIDSNLRSNRSSAATIKPLNYANQNPSSPISIATPTLSSVPQSIGFPPGSAGSANAAATMVASLSSMTVTNGNTGDTDTTDTSRGSMSPTPASSASPSAAPNTPQVHAPNPTPNITVDEDGTVNPFAGLDLEHLGSAMPDFDFDKALLKFAAERENFLEDLSFSAGAKLQARPPMVSPRLDRIRDADAASDLRRNPLRSIKGSIRRKISFRDMSSVRKQPMTPKPGRLDFRSLFAPPCLDSKSGKLNHYTVLATTAAASLLFFVLLFVVSTAPVASTNRALPVICVSLLSAAAVHLAPRASKLCVLPAASANIILPTTAASVRTTRRLSHYNSVIPPPEPLNTDPDMHPLKRRFEPVLLDRYPPRDVADEVARRGKFPDYIPMFAFPNDIQIVSSDDRPRSTWHGFTMTSDDNSKIYGITIVIWTALSADVAEDVEQRCEEWRQSHMSNEERELAASLGVRLARERTVLSQLLARLGTVASGTDARDILEDQISAVEEKITLMTEMLRPLRHGAASKIDGLTNGETGLWVPRAYGILGRDATKMSFWKEWLRAVVVPMTDGAVLRVPATSPRVGRWQPMERYVVNLCMEAFSPLGSMTQVELGVRELRLYARKEAVNELPGSRTIDIYALFRCLSLENIMALFEFAMSESRIIFLSSHSAMLHLACHALACLLYPLKWSSIFIPILPARLLSALEAPCPYIVGVERRYERIDLPEDDYVLVDLDRDTIDATTQPHRLPRQHRRKLMSLLQAAAPHRLRYGVTGGPPPYAIESFPYDAFSAENSSLFTTSPGVSTLGKWVSQNSSTFAAPEPQLASRKPMFNAFASVRPDPAPNSRPDTSKSSRTSPPNSVSLQSINLPQLPSTPVSMSDSGFVLTATLREKRSGHFDDRCRRSSSFGMDKHAAMVVRPAVPFLGHQASLSVSAISVDSQSSVGGSINGNVNGGGGGGYAGYAPSMYAPSTLAASTIMPNMLMQPVRNTETTIWVEGHRFEWCPNDMTSTCTICEDKPEGDGVYKCMGCATVAHGRCLGFVSLVCPEAFHEDRVRAAFVRCLASLLYTYRKHLQRPSKEQKANGKLYSFDMDGFIKSLPYDQQEYTVMMRDTQGEHPNCSSLRSRCMCVHIANKINT